MENAVFTQLTVPEVRKLFRQELQTFLENKPLPSSEPRADEPLTVQQAADFFKLSVPMFDSLVSRSAIPVSKSGKGLYFARQRLAARIETAREK